MFHFYTARHNNKIGDSMPKVSEEYFIQKKQFISDAAYRVCLKKPVSTVTMMDIIKETGLSQGGIYRFYPDLDAILQDMILKLRQNFNIISDTDQIFEQFRDSTPLEFSEKICELLADRMEKSLMDVQKINFDLSVLAINEPERVRKILDGINEEGNMEHLTKCTVELMSRKIEEGHYKPRIPLEDIMQYISCMYGGIERNCIVSHCYSYGPMSVSYSPRPLFKTLAKTIAYLLGDD